LEVEDMERQQLAEQLFKVLFGRQSVAQYAQTRVNSDRDALQSDMLTQLEGEQRELAVAAEAATPWKEVGARITAEAEELIVRDFVTNPDFSDQDLRDLVTFFSSSLGQRYVKVRLAQTGLMEPIIRRHILDAHQMLLAKLIEAEAGKQGET
jgi:ribosomal protein S16